jgi:hypothetical protein
MIAPGKQTVRGEPRSASAGRQRYRLLLLVLGVIVGWQSTSSAAASALAPFTQSSAGSVPNQAGSDLGLGFDVLEASRKIEYERGGRNIFRMAAEFHPISTSRTPPKPLPPSDHKVIPAPTPPPVIPMKYYGFASRRGEPGKAFLEHQQGAQIFIAAPGEIVAWRYRLLEIAPNSVIMEDVLTGNHQLIPLTLR